MLILLLLCIIFALGFWAYLNFSPTQRMNARFQYGAADTPDSQNGLFRGDDVTWGFAGDPESWPAVTIVVPGRNEGHVLADTLGSLCRFDYPRLRIVFINDQSTDNTREVCATLQRQYSHLEALHNEEPPRDGWIGKSWAVHLGLMQPAAREAELLLFTDADLEFHPLALKQAVRLLLHRRADLVSLLPRLRVGSLGELLALLAGMTLISTALPLRRVNEPNFPKGLAAGGFMLWRKASYDAIGGHESVRGQMIEDIALAKLAKTKGKRVFTTFARDLMTARMYEGWRDTFVGLRKNAYAGVMYSPINAVASIVAILAGIILVPVYVALGTFLWITQPSPLTFVICLLSYLAMACMLSAANRSAKLLGFHRYAGWLMPFGMAFYMCIFVASIIEHYRGGNTWAGRRVQTKDKLIDIR